MFCPSSEWAVGKKKEKKSDAGRIRARGGMEKAMADRISQRESEGDRILDREFEAYILAV